MKAFSYGIIPYILSNKGVNIMLSKTSKTSDYGFIKGKIDKGETPKECTEREVFEEIGINIDIEDLENLVIQKNPKKNIGLFYINFDKYLNQEIKLQEKEIYSIDYFNIRDLPKISKNQRLILTNIIQRFGKIDYLLKNT
jgi:8-oxo-dGTP pyrophosphatase MutT (NUDIX family)